MQEPQKPQSLGDLGTRLKAARAVEAGRQPPRERESARDASRYGMAWRLSVELVAGLVIGGGIGWLIDSVVNSRPWFFLVFFLLGAIAGLRNVYRTAARINAPGAADETSPRPRGKADSGADKPGPGADR